MVLNLIFFAAVNGFIIPPQLFEIKMKMVFVEILFSSKKENSSNQFIKNLNDFTDNKFYVFINRIGQKAKQLLRVKNLSVEVVKFIEGIWSCGDHIIFEKLSFYI